jgi:ATP-dependent RNA helicase DeaD
MSFAELGAHPSLQRALQEKGYLQATPVQAAVLAPDLAGHDLLVSAETGSGKTVAFGLAIAPTLLGEDATFQKAGRPLALVIAPTRELATQVQKELAWLYQPANGRTAACVGGSDVRMEQRALSNGAQIVVGTPGRLVDHLERGSLVLDQIRAVILDEADEMLDMGFREELERILGDAPKARRTLMFSATIPHGIAQLAERYQRDARRVAATPPQQSHRDIEYRAHVIALKERENAVVNVLRQNDAAAAIVFCTTRDAVNHLHANLVERGFGAVAISGELTQTERTRALKALRDGRARVLVATDVAARGLDLPDVGLIIQADLPHDASVLQHRSGRTGRAGRKGVSVILVPAAKRRMAEQMFRDARSNIAWSPVPSADAIRALDQQRIVKEIISQPTEVSDEDLNVAKMLLAERTPEQIASLLVTLYRTKLPSAEDLPMSLALPVQGPPQRSSPRGPHLGSITSRSASPASRSSHPAPHTGNPTPHAPHATPHPASPTSHLKPNTPPRIPRAPSGESAGSVWFTINVGRSTNADPRWLVPLLCRRGEVTKADIGAIRIFAEETKVEITAAAADRFSRAARMPDRQDPRIRIVPSAAPFANRAPRPPRGPDDQR